ncbi:MAG: hypothetical protein NZ869_07565 [Thermoanaerobaculum sp.]|nr:hypothetical protein [Thermoanaerobaculum sp.]MDW7966572.1 hypothetical protein [Thermoanaerobaculum sp.]
MKRIRGVLCPPLGLWFLFFVSHGSLPHLHPTSSTVQLSQAKNLAAHTHSCPQCNLPHPPLALPPAPLTLLPADGATAAEDRGENGAGYSGKALLPGRGPPSSTALLTL